MSGRTTEKKKFSDYLFEYKKVIVGTITGAVLSGLGWVLLVSYSTPRTLSDHERQLQAQKAATEMLSISKVDKEDDERRWTDFKQSLEKYFENQEKINETTLERIERLEDIIMQNNQAMRSISRPQVKQDSVRRIKFSQSDTAVKHIFYQENPKQFNPEYFMNDTVQVTKVNL